MTAECRTTLLLWTLAASVMRGDAFTAGNETALRAQIFTGYDTSVRPNDVTYVVMTFLPTSLGEIVSDIKSQAMAITGWWIMHWNDSRLTWDPTAFDSITETHVYQHKLWTPPLVVYNSVDNLSAIKEDTIPLRVSSTGTVHWSPSSILTVSCSTDITYFPFDTQTCPISVTSFGYTLAEVELHPILINTTFYQPSGEWDLLDTFTVTEPSESSFIDFKFVFRRKPGYYGLNFLLPVMLCWVLSVFIFVLPPESGERMGYSLTILLAFVVLMSLLADRMPTTADHVSCFELYIVLVLAFCVISVICSILNLAIYFRDDSRPIPRWLRRFTLFLQRHPCWASTKVTQVHEKQEGLSALDASGKDRKWAAPSASGQRPEGKEGEGEGKGEENEKGELTWKEISYELDAFGLKVYLIVTALIAFILLSVMGGHY